MIGDFPTAPLGSDEWDAQVAASVQAQLAADQAAWEKEFGKSSATGAAVQQSQADGVILAGVILGLWFLSKK